MEAAKAVAGAVSLQGQGLLALEVWRSTLVRGILDIRASYQVDRDGREPIRTPGAKPINSKVF